MKNIKYYLDLSHGFLLAYEKSVEFFVRYIPERGEWDDCGISFSSFRHDYDFREISREEAIEKAGGCLPEEAYRQYYDTITKNRG